MNPFRLAIVLSAFVSAAAFAQPVPQGAGGGDGVAKARTASMIVEGEDTADEITPPVPQGDERRMIGDYIRDNSGDVRDCYARRLQEKPTLSGKLVARFDIGPNGKVIGATADGIADRELVLCVVTAVRKWEFEKPQNGAKLRIAYPFKFEPQPTR